MRTKNPRTRRPASGEKSGHTPKPENLDSYRPLSSNTRNQNTVENASKILRDNDFQLECLRCPAKPSTDLEGGGKVFLNM